MTATILPTTLGPADVDRLIATDPGTRLLDVRTPAEYEAAHIEGAYNIPLDTLAEHAAEIRTVCAPVVLVCQSGQRARRADETLRQAGMSNLHVLEGGLGGWVAAGRPVRRGAKHMSLERQVRILAGGLAAAGGLLALLVHPRFALVPAVVGGGLVFAGITDTCGMGLALSKLPYNRPPGCDAVAMAQAFAAAAPAGPRGNSWPAR